MNKTSRAERNKHIKKGKMWHQSRMTGRKKKYLNFMWKKERKNEWKRKKGRKNERKKKKESTARILR